MKLAASQEWDSVVGYAMRRQDKQISVGKQHVARVRSRDDGPLGCVLRFLGIRDTVMPKTQAVENAKLHFQHYVEKEYESILKELTPDLLKAETKRLSREACKVIIDKTTAAFQQGGKGAGICGKTLVQAHIAAQEALIELRQKLQKEQPGGPNVFFAKEGDVCVISRAPTLCNLVFKGGGAKGGAYVPVLKSMENYRLASGIQHVTGTSVGAITAACVATGMSANDYATLTGELKINECLGDADTETSLQLKKHWLANRRKNSFNCFKRS